MKFIGVDLTSAFSNDPRAIDIAVIEGDQNIPRPLVSFHQVRWPASALVAARDTHSLYAMLTEDITDGEQAVFAIDGPQGLALNVNGRVCELHLGTPGRTPVALPAAQGGGPFQTYIRSSIDLFNALMQTPLNLAGLRGVALENATLFEIFPGSEWTVLAARRLDRKASVLGRRQRAAVFQKVLQLPHTPLLPTPDQLDALSGAYLAWCTRNRPAAVELVGEAPIMRDRELCEGFILHATKPSPGAGDVSALLPDASQPIAPAEAAVAPQDETWADDTLRLFLMDYGVVWGSEPENAWMQPSQNYACQTLAPYPIVQFMLTYAPNVHGQRGWTSNPTVKPLLRQLNLPVPDHLSRNTGVTLRIHLLP